jgi:osmotically-inducible protein OsmY
MMRVISNASALAFVALLLLGGAAVGADDKAVSDNVLHDQVRLRLASDTTVQGGGVQVEVKNGAITLRGRIRTEKGKEKATKLVKKIKGVKSVDNQLVVDSTTP